MANWRKTRFPGVYVAHSKACPALDDPSARCRCTPSWRGRRRNPITGKPEWQKPVVKHRTEMLAWLAAADAGSEHLRELGEDDAADRLNAYLRRAEEQQPLLTRGGARVSVAP